MPSDFQVSLGTQQWVIACKRLIENNFPYFGSQSICAKDAISLHLLLYIYIYNYFVRKKYSFYTNLRIKGKQINNILLINFSYEFLKFSCAH